VGQERENAIGRRWWKRRAIKPGIHPANIHTKGSYLQKFRGASVNAFNGLPAVFNAM